jgi:PAS domain S-box-containing protein
MGKMVEKTPFAREEQVQRAIFDLAGDGFLLVDADHFVLQANERAARMFQYATDEIVGQRADRLFVSFCPAFFEPTNDGSEGTETPCSVRRLEGRRKDDTKFPLEISVRRIEAPSGPLGVLCLRRPRWVESGPNADAADFARIGGFGYWSRDLASDEVSMSAETLAILDVNEDAVATDPETLLRFVHPKDASEVDSAMKELLTTGARMDVTHRIVLADDTGKVVRSVGELRFDADGNPVEIVGIAFDVTDRERVAEALRESENTLSAIVNSTTAMIYIKDTEGKYLLINRHYENVFGVSNEALRGNTDYEVFPEVIADALRANDVLVLNAGKPVEFEEQVPQDGEKHDYISIKFPLRRSSGEIYAICGISTDITGRKRAEAELEATKQSLERLVEERTAALRETNRRLKREIVEHEEAAAQLQRLIHTAREGIWVMDNAGITTFANPRMGEILGYEAGEMIGRSMFEFMTEEWRGEAERNLERRRRGISEDHDFEFCRKDGSAVWTLISTGPVRDKSGEPIGALAMVTDISERKHAEEHQALLLQELDHRVKNTLATVTALSDMTMERAGTVAEFGKAFGGRIQAMARTHEALAGAKWKEVSFEELVTLVLEPMRTGGKERIVAEGDPIRLPPHAITPLALTLNELGTNALKHGALSDGRGTVRLSWELSESDSFSLTWRERDGPTVRPPQTEGTGIQLIRGFIEYELGGTLALDFASDGLVFHVDIPALGGL